MSATQQFTDLETLSACLLRLGREARDVAPAAFLGRAAQVMRDVLPFRRGWWGLATSRGAGMVPSIYQADYINLSTDFASAWRAFASADDFAVELVNPIGRVCRFVESGNEAPDALAFDARFGLYQGMGLVLDEASTGHAFFMVLYRDREDALFSDQEAMLFLHLMRHALQLWHHALQDALATASREEGLARAALARPDGALLFAGPQFCELLYAQWPSWDGIQLPSDIVAQFGVLPCRIRLSEGAIDISVHGDHLWLVHVGARERHPLSLLSPRERRTATLFAAGHSYKEIARQLSLTPATVRTYLRTVYLRLGVTNKVQLGDAIGRVAGRGRGW